MNFVQVLSRGVYTHEADFGTLLMCNHCFLDRGQSGWKCDFGDGNGRASELLEAYLFESTVFRLLKQQNGLPVYQYVQHDANAILCTAKNYPRNCLREDSTLQRYRDWHCQPESSGEPLLLSPFCAPQRTVNCKKLRILKLTFFRTFLQSN